MTREEAIEIISRVDICANAAETARDMAIAALREQEERSKGCDGCWWKNRVRHQKCSCCRRNWDMKDCYEVEK